MGQRYEAPKEFSGTNLCYRFSYTKGDVDEGFEKADHIFEDTFRFPRVQHFSMEPHATVAHVESDRMTFWAGTQEPFTLREHLADIFHMPLNKIRIIVPYLGGGYGGKLAVKTEPLAVALSWKAKRPVRLAHSIEESFRTVTRHPARVQIKTGVTKDGRAGCAAMCHSYGNRRLCRCRAQSHAKSRLPLFWSIPCAAYENRRLYGLHQHRSGGRLPRFWHAASDLGL